MSNSQKSNVRNALLCKLDFLDQKIAIALIRVRNGNEELRSYLRFLEEERERTEIELRGISL